VNQNDWLILLSLSFDVFENSIHFFFFSLIYFQVFGLVNLFKTQYLRFSYLFVIIHKISLRDIFFNAFGKKIYITIQKFGVSKIFF